MLKFMSLVLALLPINCIAQQLDCSLFRTGKFKSIENDIGTTFIQRNDSLHIETNDKIKTKFIYNVSWIDSCTYVLKIKKRIFYDKKFPFPENAVHTIKIVAINKDSYKYIATTNYDSRKFTGVIYKVK